MTLILTQEKLEDYFTQVNILSTNQPKELTAYALIVVDSQISTAEVRFQMRKSQHPDHDHSQFSFPSFNMGALPQI